MFDEKPTRTDAASADSPAPREDDQPQPIVTPKFSLRLAIGMMVLFAAIMMIVRFVGEDWSERKQLIAVSVIFGWGVVTALLVLLAISLRGKMQRKLGRPIYQYSYTWVIDFQAALVSNMFCYVFGAVAVVFVIDEQMEAMALAAPTVLFAILLQLGFLFSILFPVQVACCERGVCFRGTGMFLYAHIRESRWTETLQHPGQTIVWCTLHLKMLPEVDRRVFNVLIPSDAQRRVDEILTNEIGDRHESLPERTGERD